MKIEIPYKPILSVPKGMHGTMLPDGIREMSQSDIENDRVAYRWDRLIGENQHSVTYYIYSHEDQAKRLVQIRDIALKQLNNIKT